MDNSSESIILQLSKVLEAQLGEVTISDLTRLTGGANRETWSFDAVTKVTIDFQAIAHVASHDAQETCHVRGDHISVGVLAA